MLAKGAPGHHHRLWYHKWRSLLKTVSWLHVNSRFSVECSTYVKRNISPFLLSRLCAPGQSETILFLPVRCSFAVAVAAGVLGTSRIFQNDFYICVTRFNNSVTHEISVTIMFILCETIMACFFLCRLFNSLTAGIVLVGQFWYVGTC